MAKYVFITGGVLSGLGKGVITASTGLLLKSIGYSVTAIKIDPYVNVDAGTMNPYMHGEVFVTEDGGETDLDIGHYERFLNQNLTKKHNITTGQIYYSVIMKERRGEYLGKCVQIIPHVTDEIKERIRSVAKETHADIVLVEIGGTVGDIEGLPFLEAIRQMRIEEGYGNTVAIHVALAPIISTGEQKTKPVQHSIQELRRIGIQPDIVVVRSPRELEEENRAKIALYSNLSKEAVYSDPDVDIIYRVPIILHRQGYTKYLAEKLRLEYREPDLSKWYDFLEKLTNPKRKTRIAMIGKYTKLHDSYLSIIEALKHAGAWNNTGIELGWFEATDIENGKLSLEKLLEYDGAVILPGFGKRGAEGKIKAIRFLRENNKPLLGICFGMQLMVVEYARNVVGLERAHSTEIDPNTPYPVIDLLPSQYNVKHLGGTMRLGAHPIHIKKNTIAWQIYRREIVYERHRHRYEVNPKYIDKLENAGLKISGWSPEKYPEFIELPKYRTLYFGSQPHPEFKSRPLTPAPIYYYFIKKIVGD
ncbi:CTP synthase [Staphylothermus marinus F1]|uniref:CTP synthase n=1 Tax=Staphylothermus marinus (strain ATCC 43588 / DSM 3639 / JCM 9404 / F1) TaxID=399550 RepID=A3DM51_STAMF|nr:CTP synthase [Staphylothermus marinus]ABN69711.1 CTP synthase [Staphylothermus marinus F1]